MITAAAIALFTAGWVVRGLAQRAGQISSRPALGPAVQKQLRRTRAPWIQ